MPNLWTLTSPMVKSMLFTPSMLPCPHRRSWGFGGGKGFERWQSQTSQCTGPCGMILKWNEASLPPIVMFCYSHELVLVQGPLLAVMGWGSHQVGKTRTIWTGLHSSFCSHTVVPSKLTCLHLQSRATLSADAPGTRGWLWNTWGIQSSLLLGNIFVQWA